MLRMILYTAIFGRFFVYGTTTTRLRERLSKVRVSTTGTNHLRQGRSVPNKPPQSLGIEGMPERVVQSSWSAPGCFTNYTVKVLHVAEGNLTRAISLISFMMSTLSDLTCPHDTYHMYTLLTRCPGIIDFHCAN
jgi:hypothetical protein